MADEAALREHASGVLAPAKRPKTYLHVAELPLTATGKVRRDQLPRVVTGAWPPTCRTARRRTGEPFGKN